MTTLTFGAALALLGMGQAEAARTKQCIALDELRGFTGYLLPSLLEVTMRECQPHLAADGYLRSQGPALLERLSTDRDADWPLARQAFAKFGTDNARKAAELDSVPDAQLRTMVETGMTEKLVGKLSAETCGDAERVIATFDPMPRKNVVELIAVVFNMASRDDRETPSCPVG